MKKVLSLVLVLAMVLSMGVVAFADITAVGGFACLAPGDTEAAVYTAPGTSPVTLSQYNPGTKFYWTIMDNDTPAQLTTANKTLIDAIRVDAKFTDGKSLVSSYKIVTDNSKYYYEIATKKTYGTTDAKDLTVTLDIVNKTNNITIDAVTDLIAKTTFSTKIGWVINEYDCDGNSEYAFSVSNNDPVAKIKGTGTVVIDLTNSGATFTVKNTGTNKVNLYTNTDANKDLVVKNDNVDMDFINFPGNPSFDFNGKLVVPTDAKYAYINNNGKLTAVDAKNYDADDEEWTITTNKLTSYVFSDTKLESVDGTTTSDNTSTNNPGTGSSDVVGVAVALAVVSLAAAGAVAFKKVK